jgi:hypothetical protein
MIKYHYAYDEDHHLVSINAIDKVSAKTHSYFCVSCGHELFPKLGEVRAHHFAHKKDVNCDGESYLHKLAKIKLKEKFDNKAIPFEIEFQRKLFCKDKDECPFYDESICYKYDTFKFDLHKFYDTCVEEQTIYIDNSASEPIVSFEPKDESEKYIADLLLYDSTKKDRQPVLIEIYCSHKCEEKKTQSKLKIIEIHITSDEDIDKWVANTIVEDNNEYNELGTKEVKFINFNPGNKFRTLLNNGSITRFIYSERGSMSKRKLTCDQLHISCSQNSIVELNIPCKKSDCYRLYDYGLVYLLEKGYDICNCVLCSNYIKYFKIYSCRLHENDDLKFPEIFEATMCQNYYPDEEYIRKIEQELRTKGISEV